MLSDIGLMVENSAHSYYNEQAIICQFQSIFAGTDWFEPIGMNIYRFMIIEAVSNNTRGSAWQTDLSGGFRGVRDIKPMGWIVANASFKGDILNIIELQELVISTPGREEGASGKR